MIVTELIEKKRYGEEMTEEEIRFLINGLVNKEVEDCQMSAWMMAVCINGMTDRETADLTLAMMHSGDTVDLSDLPGVKVDKHSTGGVGDTTTLVVGPLVAACGGTVAKMSGRGLAHSGGTLDKLESVPGVCVEQPLERFKQIVRSNGIAVIGQSADLDPADKKMYALRDVTATVKSIPLIASSIMSKKLASGADAIVLDVKTGNGAFMNTLDESKRLAEQMVRIGESLGRRTVAVITDMNRPLGMAIGNGLEMKEAIDVLKGKVPESDPLVEVCLELGSQMLMISGLAENKQQARAMLHEALVSGRGFEKLRTMLIEMGGDARFVDHPELLIGASRIIPVYPEKAGYIGEIDAKDLGLAACLLGAGRLKKGDPVDPAVGILMNKRYGDRVGENDPYAYLYVNNEDKLDEAMELISKAVVITDSEPEQLPLIYDIIE
ncbi:MAG: thymidine phosphorylase [Clostridiales bacterium]|nr:thymidine phosphorylase [Clostridiales bacterium]